MSSFTPRLTAPSGSDPRWIMTAYGGDNDCIAGSNGPPSVLPNCTGYVHGRAMEIADVHTDNLGLPFGDAYSYWYNATNDWVRDTEPSLGAIVCYYQIATGAAPGHVSVVEEIIDADTIVVSESDYGGSYFKTWTCRREWAWTPFSTPSEYLVAFQGFLRNPYVTPEPPTPSGGGKYAILMLAGIRKRRNNGRFKRNTGII